MPTLTLKGLPADVHRRLKARAARHGRSLNVEAIACLRAALEQIEALRAEGVRAIVVDMHCEATSEKNAMGWFLDGKVSAVLGT
ncbi:MAG TPA: YmdB family metallophosphoesterase, partial [Anaeromyxobacteraceae bacterium]|nr:YmdB family metallophosphoesterase [Anaeromyxobacteraceae bacterium]